MSTPISPGLRSEASGRIPDPRPLPGDPLQSEDFAKAGPVNYGRVNLACGTNGTEQRGGCKVVVCSCSRLSANESNYLSVHCNPWSYCNLNEIHESIVKNDELALIFCF